MSHLPGDEESHSPQFQHMMSDSPNPFCRAGCADITPKVHWDPQMESPRVLPIHSQMQLRASKGQSAMSHKIPGSRVDLVIHESNPV